MGKILPKPKMPSANVITKPAPTIITTPDTTVTDENAQRIADLAARRRGLLGTVATSFEGILSQATSPIRKTLLGE